MSLEASIQDLNNNIVTLIAVLTTPDRLAAASAGATAPAQPAKKAPKTAPAAALVAATSLPTPDAAPAPQPAAAPIQPAQAAAPAPTIEAARALVIELGQKKGREAVMTLLSGFGVTKLPEVNPSRYAEVISKASEALAA